jgi:choline-sulfatase
VKPANLLVVMSDEHDPRYMGCSGHGAIRTPNLDRLARRGTRFASAYTNSPICVPARASFATGRYVHETGCWDNALAWTGRPEGWPHRLRAAGIRNETIGKLHYRSRNDPLGIDRQIEPMHILEGIGQVWGSVRNPLPARRDGMPMLQAIGPGLSSYNLYDQRIAAHAREWFDAARGARQPWVLFVGLVAPHFPLVAPRPFFDLYDRGDIPDPKLLPESGYRRHPWVERLATFQDHDAALGPKRRKDAIHAYWALVSFMDAQVGAILEALEAAGLGETTRVIYTSDHGDNAGARGLWGKSVLYEESTRIPLLLAGPDFPQGRISTTPVSLVDVHPSILDAVGLASDDDRLPGRSLFALALEDDDADRIVFSEYHATGAPTGAFMLRKGRYKLHHYVGYPPELFDLASDPEETRDLASNPAHGAVLADCEAALRNICNPEAVDARAKSDQDRLVATFGGAEAAFNAGTPAATPAPGAPASGAAHA